MREHEHEMLFRREEIAARVAEIGAQISQDFAGEAILMHGGAIFGFQSVIERMPKHRELIVLLENSDSPKLLEIARDIRSALVADH